MSQIQNQNPGSTEIQSPLIAGITEALNKISSVLSMNVGSLSDAQLIPVSIDENENNQRRIYEAPQGNRLWLSEPAPVFKINGSVITQEQYSFSIDYVGGSITFTTSQKPSASDKVTVTASYIINQSKFVNDINSAVSDLEEKSARYKGSFENKDALILEHPSGENGDFAILFSPFAVYAWKNDGWYDTRSIEDLSDYYKKSEVNNLLNQKEPTIRPKGNSASDDNHYWGGRKTWQDLFAKVRSVTLTGLSTATSTAVTATDTVLSSIGKLQGQINKIISDGFGFKSFSKAVFPENETGNIDPTSPMLMANLTATSAADRLDHVVVPGKTTQAGSGDPSPSNVRPITGVGRKMVKKEVTGNEEWVYYAPDKVFYTDGLSISKLRGGFYFSNLYPEGAYNTYNNVMLITTNNGRLHVRDDRFSSISSWKQHLQDLYAAGTPLVIYYVPADESQAAGWYTHAAVDGDTYAAVGMELDGPLFDGDSVNNTAETPSGRQCAVYRQMVLYTLTGQESYTQEPNWNKGAVTIESFLKDAVSVEGFETQANIVCSHLVTGIPETIVAQGNAGCGQGRGTSLFLNFGSPYNTLESAKAYIQQQYADGTPVQILATLATPTTTYSDAQPLVNPPGTWTLSAENTPQGYMRALSDANRADYAEQAKQADDASKLGGRTLAQIVPKYTAAETAMPYTWLDGKTVYRQCLELAVSDFDQSTTEQFYPDYAGTITETSTTQLNSKTVVLNGAALILPTSCATSLSSDGQSIRPISNTRPGGQGYELGWRFDKSGAGWKISVDIGRFRSNQFSKFLFVIYYTK